MSGINWGQWFGSESDLVEDLKHYLTASILVPAGT